MSRSSKADGRSLALAIACFVVPGLAVAGLSFGGPGSAAFDQLPWLVPVLTIGSSFAGVVLLMAPVVRAEAERERLLQEGAYASGVIRGLKETGLRINKRPMVRFELDVTPHRGAPYRAEAERLISVLEVPSYQPGCALELRVDRDDPQEVAIVGPA